MCKLDYTNCKNVTRTPKALEALRTVYYNTFAQMQVMEYPVNVSGDDLLNLQAFIMLVNNHLIPLTVNANPTYLKALYHVKLRTNLSGIKFSLTDDAQEYADRWLENMKHPEFNLINITSAFDLNAFLDSLILPTHGRDYGFVISNLPETIDSLVPSHGIFFITKETMDQLTRLGATVTTVHAIQAHGLPPPFVSIVDNQLRYDNTGQIMGFDIGEWNIVNGSVHFELRGVNDIYNLLEKQETGAYPVLDNTDIFKSRGLASYKVFCNKIYLILKTFLDTMFVYTTGEKEYPVFSDDYVLPQLPDNSPWEAYNMTEEEWNALPIENL